MSSILPVYIILGILNSPAFSLASSVASSRIQSDGMMSLARSCGESIEIGCVGMKAVVVINRAPMLVAGLFTAIFADYGYLG